MKIDLEDVGAVFGECDDSLVNAAAIIQFELWEKEVSMPSYMPEGDHPDTK